MHASDPRKPEARPITAAPPASAGSLDLPTRQSGAFLSTHISSIGERALIERITTRLSMPRWVIVGPGDDAAVIAPERGALDVITTDAIVEGVHFDLAFTPPAAVGHRALAVNLSDLAAMGAAPRAALLSLALPPSTAVTLIDELVDGLLALAATHHVMLVGGNITRTTGPIMVDVTAIGSVRPRRILRRQGARPGDLVYVTGTLGDAAVGLRSLRANPRSVDHVDRLEARYLRPEPRVRAGALLGRNRVASSCMDLSDGLADGLRQVSAASGVGMAIDTADIPMSDQARRWHADHGSDPVDTALTGGDDYELIFTVRPTHRGRLRGVQRLVGDLPITKIGVVTKGADIVLKETSGTRPLPGGYDHFT